MPPVGSYVSALSVMSERDTASVHSPAGQQRADQSLQNFSVAARAVSGATGSAGGMWDGLYASTNGTVCPASTANVETVVKPAGCKVTGVKSDRRSGPAMAVSVLPLRRTHGTSTPY